MVTSKSDIGGGIYILDLRAAEGYQNVGHDPALMGPDQIVAGGSYE